MAAWTAPTVSALGNMPLTVLKAILPHTPPTADPSAIGSMERTLTVDVLATLFCTSVASDMVKTDTLDRKLTADTLMTPSASTMGLMITPPPIPHSGPSRDARKHTTNTTR